MDENLHVELLKAGRKEFALAIQREPSAVKALAFAHASGKPVEKIISMAIKAVAKTLGMEEE